MAHFYSSSTAFLASLMIPSIRIGFCKTVNHAKRCSACGPLHRTFAIDLGLIVRLLLQILGAPQSSLNDEHEMCFFIHLEERGDVGRERCSEGGYSRAWGWLLSRFFRDVSCAWVLTIT